MKKLTTDMFITKAKKVHGDLYDYSMVVYINSKLKIKIKCYKHGMFEQEPNSHLCGNKGRGVGCPICNDTKLTTEEFIKRSKKMHGTLYNYSDVVYINAHTKIKIYYKRLYE